MTSRMLRTLVFALFAFFLSVGVRAQMIPLETIDSIDAKVLTSQTVAVGTVTDVVQGKENPEWPGLRLTEVTIAVQETLKGRAAERLVVGLFESLPVVEKWKSSSTRLLVFSPLRPSAMPLSRPLRPSDGLPTRPIDLDDEKLLVFRSDFTAIRNRDELLRYIRQLVRAHPEEKKVETFVLPADKGPGGVAWLKSIGRPHIAGLRVPADARLEKSAKERLRSKDLEERRTGLRALALFPTDENKAIVRRLLTDPVHVSYIPVESNWGIEQRNYPIRIEADRVARSWGMAVGQPVLEESVSQIATVKSLEWRDRLTEAHLIAIREAKSLTSLDIQTYPPVPEGLLDAVVGATGLTQLHLPEMSVDDARLGKLAALKDLRSLNLDRNPITDEGLKTLATFASLRELSVAFTEVTNAGLAELRRARPDLRVKPDHAMSPLNFYIDRGDMAGVRKILDRHPEAVGEDNGYTLGGLPLHEAAYQRRYDAVKLLLERGASVQALNGYGHTALQSAMVYFDPDLAIMELLIAHGSDVNRVNPEGKPPLVVAAQAGNTQLVRLLLASGADPFSFTKDKLGYASSRPETLDVLANLTALKKNPVPLINQSYARCDRTVYSLGSPDAPLSNWSTLALGAMTGPFQWGRTPSGRDYIGPLGQQSATLKVSGLAEHRNVRVEIDLFIIGSWDGNGGLVFAPDIFDIGVTGLGTLMHSTFSNNGEDDAAGLPMQSFPDPYPFGFHPTFNGASEVRTLGFEQTWQGRVYRRDAVYKLVFTFAHTGKDLELLLSSLSVTEGEGSLAESEQWGIGRLVIKTD